MTAADFTTAARAEAPEPCEHHWVSHGQDSVLIPWVIHCDLCGAFDVAEMERAVRARLAAQEPTDAELDALYDAFVAHDEDERSEEYTRTEDGEPYSERICSECGEVVWIKGEHYWASARANGARKRHHVARAALRAARDVRGQG